MTVASARLNKLTDLQNQILDVIARLRFATAEQLLYWLPVDALSSVRRGAIRLTDLGLLETRSDLRPYVYRLSSRGCALTGERYFRRWHSASAVQQYLLRNAIEIELREEDPSARVQPRQGLSSIGLYPAHAEHAFVLPNKLDLFLFVIVDDYLMTSNRILHKWNREHLRESQSAQVTSLKRWRDVSQACRVYTVCEHHAKRHGDYLQRQWEKMQSPLPISVQLIEPIWGVSQ